ncbi:hypothetical protein HIM_06574 [Hirsutella minnesotensis 3608]|uniref:Uncharacterized protein n=1 Tax=Hirsutella minnesotensis 3608 TaxID=1043627 RepID=A0A0F7ZNP8_9HYPO|nr:hypothetical protein HIM_06574 [Hirsutella minnesotensis 3608]
MARNILSPQFFLPHDSVKLGRLTTSVDQPHQNYHDPAGTKPPEVLISVRDAYTGVRQTATGSGFGSGLTSLMSAALSKRARTNLRVTTDQVKTYVLANSDDWFEEATGIPATRSWIERQIDRGRKLYVVVGFHTITDARIVQESARQTSAQGHAELPASLSLAALGAVAPLGNILDPSIEGHHYDLDDDKAHFLAAGEQVCAFQYRKLCHRWLSSNKLDQSQLSKLPRWASVETWRDAEDDEDDVIEVELTQELDLDGEWHQQQVAGDELLFIHSIASHDKES